MNLVEPKSPKAEANRLSALLSACYGPERFPVDVEQLSKDYAQQFGHADPITKVIGDDLPGFEGALYRTARGSQFEWAIIYNSSVRSPGRIRFTMAHELGHYIFHRNSRTSFECSTGDMLHWESAEKRPEVEADLFASYLLMPIGDYRERVGQDVVDMERLGECAQRYAVSLTAAVLKWLEFTAQRAVLVVSMDGHILWARSSETALKSGAFFKTRGRVIPIPQGSLAARDDVTTPERQGIEVAARIWFPKEPREMPLREMKIVSDRFEQTMSLLILPPAEPRHWQQNGENRGDDDGLDSFVKSGFFPK